MAAGYRFPNDATPAGSAAYYAVRFAAPAIRDDLAVLFAWYAEIRRIRTLTDTGVARVKLRWWRDEVNRATLGQATHPLATALAGVLSRAHVTAAPLAAIADAMDLHLTSASYDTAAQIAEHHRATGGRFAALIAAVVTASPGDNLAAEQAGAFQAAVNTLGRLGAELTAPVPLVPRAALAHHAATGDPAALVSRLCDAARDLLPEEGPPRDLPPPVAGLQALATARLTEIRRAGPLVLRAEVDLTPIRKLWTVWRRR